MNIIDLHNKTVLITGAGSGIGQQASIVASQQGARVILVDISNEGLQQTVNLLPHADYVIRTVDLTKIETLDAIIGELVEKHGPLSGLVHCAGISSRKPLNVLKKEGFEKLMNINFFSFVELVKCCARQKRFNNGGSIIVMSSISSIKGYKAKTEYCVSKSSVDSFVRCMALELAPRKIRINSIMPAEVLTPMAQKFKELNKTLGNNEFSSPLGPSEPFEIANLIVFLLSDATKTLTGTSILIDGGATI